ncbi:MAG: serine/threonine protein kinase [Actinomycetia bacterium]|nr:serine/threonine protein kinase [Actinomycetes bacterium]
MNTHGATVTPCPASPADAIPPAVPYRDVLLLMAWGGLSYEQTAEALGVPADTVRSRWNQARAKLRTALGEVDPTAPTQELSGAGGGYAVARFCTAQVLEADVHGDRPYVVSEYVEGLSLSRRVAEQGPLSDGALGRLAIGTVTALVAIHQANVVHRDFKRTT